MKFAIRDDDLNYFYTPEFIEKNLNEVIDICPVTMAAVPLVKGNWIRNTEILEAAGPYGLTNEVINSIKSDCKIYNIALNEELIAYIREKIDCGKICIAIHGIHHRNDDPILPEMPNNFAIGAEFETKMQLFEPLMKSVQILENCFGQNIRVFTPPQNSYSVEGASAVFGNELAMCAYLPGVRDWRKFVNLFGLENYLIYLVHRIKCRQIGFEYPYPWVLKSKIGAITDHCALQPASDSIDIIEKFKRVRDEGGNFVLSTHSYGFDYQMKKSGETMKKCLLRILNEVAKKNDVEFVTLNEIFVE
jgi:hypothetical protein